MARYQRYDHDGKRYVHDQEKDVLYVETFPKDDEYRLAPINLQQLSKFAPYAVDDGEFDEFPGEILPHRG